MFYLLKSLKSILLFSCLIFLLSSCAVLTSSQVHLIHNFGEASLVYAQLPGAVLRGYNEIRNRNSLLQITNNSYNETQDALRDWEELLKTQKYAEQMQTEIERVNDILNILNQYSNLLVNLSTDNYVADFARAAQELAVTFEQDVAHYKQKYSEDIKQISGDTQHWVKQIGGFFIRRKQTQLLRLYIQDADSIVGTLTQNIILLIQPFVQTTEVADSHLDAELKELKQIFLHKAMLDTNISICTLDPIVRNMIKIQQTRASAQRCIDCSLRYRQAHAKLAQAVGRKQDIVTEINEIRQLSERIRSID